MYKGELLKKFLILFLLNNSLKKLLDRIKKVITTNTPCAFDIAFYFEQNSLAEEFAGLLVPMKDENEQSSGIMLMLQDITDIKRSREEALEASKAKSDFLSNMSHEIRTPVNAIIGMTVIGKQESNLERKDYALKKIESASIHLIGIINDILDISKIESGKMDLSNILFNFMEMLNRVMSVISLKIKDKNQHFSTEIDPLVPKILFGDDQHLAQVITNILSNATKFTPENGEIVFKVKLLNIQGNICTIKMCVQDSGIGISKENQKKLFKIFQQADAGTARKYGGSGLGLAISKRLLELMDGQIWVESEIGKGSRFFFTANLTIPEQVELPNNILKQGDNIFYPENIIKDVDFSGKVILVADDIDINLEIMLTLLEPTNITIVTAKNGKETVDIFAANPEYYDLILMDVQMPEIDGLQATEMIRNLSNIKALSIPIIAMTANVFKEDIKKCTDAGMNNHLGKPIVMKEVIDMLIKYLK